MRYQVSHSGMFEPTTIPNWDVAVISRAGALMIDAEASEAMKREGPLDQARIPRWSLTALPPSRFHLDQEPSIQEIAYGWPLISAFSRDGWISRGEGGLVIPWFSKYDKRTLPLRPIFPGFAIDTIFYAAMLWLPFAAFGRIRRRRRIKRGLCPACAYPIGESGVCTECGKPIPGFSVKSSDPG